MAVIGEVLSARGLEAFLAYMIDSNLAHEEATGERPSPLCVWGRHGLGKTACVLEFARSRGWPLAYCAPAQFEEMGDFHGLPMRSEASGQTIYLPPKWVPKEAGPGILLIDDVNRADDRILRGLMQLLQRYEMFSWKVPPRWQIVCTANPEDEEYSVTPMDEAMLTRMLHVGMKFDAGAWASWAVANGVDSRGIDFVLTYPESVTGKRTTPRSLVQVFAKLARIPDLKQELDLVRTVAMSGLDDVTVNAIMSFIASDLEHLVTAEEILEAEDFGAVKPRVAAAAAGRGGAIRVDRLSVICTRLVLAVAGQAYAKPSARNKANVVEFLGMKELPADLRFSTHRDIAALPGQRAGLVKDPRLAKLVLGTV
jgi:MoxR-like ATPase